MQTLRDYVQSNELILDLATQLSGLGIVQGVHVEPDPDLLEQWIGRRASGSEYSPYHYTVDTPIDPAFDFAAQERGTHRLPLLVRVHLCADRVLKDVEEDRRRVLGIVNEFRSSVAIVLEDRALAVASINPGDAVREFLPGTTGGFVTDGGDIYGVTCAHVARVNQVVYDDAGNKLGTVAISSTLTPSSHGTLCNLAATGNVMDAALFLFKPGSHPPATGMRASAHYGSGQRVMMRGAASHGPNSYYFGSLGLTQLINVPDPATGASTPHCFHWLRTIRSTSFWRLLGMQTARRGDSGAFITDVVGLQWFGMLCAVDGTEGFLIDATEILTWAEAELGGGVTLRTH